MTGTVNDDATDAARLIALGMRPKLIPARDLDYADLVRRFLEDDEFADLVRAIASGLDLQVLSVTPQAGAIPVPRDGSMFEVKFDEYARRATLTGRSADKVVHGLAHMAIAALAFPRPDDLANSTYVGYVSVEEVDAVIREASRLLEERATQAEENHDPLDEAPELERAWRAYSRRPAAAATKDGRLAADTTRGMITKAARYLTEQGFLIQLNNERGGTFRTTSRYQEQVRELAATAAFAELLELGVMSITDPGGSLRVTLPEQR